MPALLFDIGNVLVTFDFTRSLARVAERSRLSTTEVLEALQPFKDSLESGQMTEEEFVFRSMDVTDFNGTKEEFLDMWCDIFAPNEPMSLTLATLPQQLPAYLLSNTNGPHLRHLLDRFSIFKHFQGGIYSHEVGCMKPQDAIYQHAIERFGLKPSETFYIDDLLPNIEAAKKLGFNAYHYDPGEHAPLHKALAAWVERAGGH